MSLVCLKRFCVWVFEKIIKLWALRKVVLKRLEHNHLYLHLCYAANQPRTKAVDMVWFVWTIFVKVSMTVKLETLGWALPTGHDSCQDASNPVSRALPCFSFISIGARLMRPSQQFASSYVTLLLREPLSDSGGSVALIKDFKVSTCLSRWGIFSDGGAEWFGWDQTIDRTVDNARNPWLLPYNTENADNVSQSNYDVAGKLTCCELS